MSRTFWSSAVALRVTLTALVFGAAWPLAADAGSAKFIPTFLVYYGGGPALTATDAAKLAKFDLIDTDRFRYQDISPNTWAAVKALNPNVQIYLYEIGPEFYNFHDAYAAVSLNDLGRYNVSRGHPMGSLNGNHPELFQLDSAGRRIYSVNFSNPGANQYSYLMNFGASAYQSYWVTGVKADIVDQPWVADGVFADNCLTFANAGGYSAASASYPTNAAWSTAMNAFSSAIAAGLHGYGQKLWCNKGDSGSAAGSAAWLALDGSANRPDVLLEEGAFAVMWGAAVQFFPEAMWKQQVDTIAATKNSSVAAMSHTQLAAGQSGTDNWGKPVTYWFGVVEGLLKMSSDNAQGQTMTFTGMPPGGWFGEGTALKRESYRYNIQALRRSVVAGLPVDTFHWLLDHSIGFNRFVMNQLNERLAQFIAAREIDRMNNPDLRVARSLAALFNPVLYPGVGEVLRITQQELAYLVGLSRQRVNEALAALEAQSTIRVEYGGLRILDLEALRSSVFARVA